MSNDYNSLSHEGGGAVPTNWQRDVAIEFQLEQGGSSMSGNSTELLDSPGRMYLEQQRNQNHAPSPPTNGLLELVTDVSRFSTAHDIQRVPADLSKRVR